MPESFTIVISLEAASDIDDAFAWIATSDPSAATRWLAGLLESMAGLAVLPKRYPLSPEFQLGLTDREIRQIIHGTGFWKYRVLYTVEGDQVLVAHVRHSARLYVGQLPVEVGDE